MGIEQQDNEDRSRDRKEKKEQQKTQDFFESQRLKAETSTLLQSLATQISQEFWIDISQVKDFISSSTLWNLDDLRSWITGHEGINLADFNSAINSAKSKIENLSKRQIDSLKSSLDSQKYSPESHEYSTSQKILPENILQKAYDPQSFTDHLLGAWVGIFDSSEAVILFVYGLWKGILLTPYHIYLLLAGKWEYDGFKNI